MAFTHYQQIRDQKLPSMEINNVKAFLKDFSVSEDIEMSTFPITRSINPSTVQSLNFPKTGS